MTQTLEQDLPHIVSAADIGEAAFSLVGLRWSQSRSGAGEHWTHACTHPWDILRVPVQPPQISLCSCTSNKERDHPPAQHHLRVGAVDQGEEHPKTGSLGNLKSWQWGRRRRSGREHMLWQ